MEITDVEEKIFMSLVLFSLPGVLKSYYGLPETIYTYDPDKLSFYQDGFNPEMKKGIIRDYIQHALQSTLQNGEFLHTITKDFATLHKPQECEKELESLIAERDFVIASMDTKIRITNAGISELQSTQPEDVVYESKS